MSGESVGSLPAPVQDTAVAPLGGGRLVLLGGLDAAQTSTAQVTLLSGGTGVSAGTLPAPQHDAQATALGGAVYVFGGGEVSSYDHILRYDPAAQSVAAAGTLPSPASDVGVAGLGSSAYIVGGYDGLHPLDSIVEWQPGGAPRLVGHLPIGVRYAAVAAVDGRLIIAGGTTEGGVSDAIFSFKPPTGGGEGSVTQIGTLPNPLTHASAAELGGRVIIVGGREQVSGAQTAAILEVDPASGAVTRVGQLPQPLSDAAVADIAGGLIVAGGESPQGTQSSILALTPHVRRVVVHVPSQAA
jgi:N-acetylneuraminic acid mutarotase